jgi:hypothetical protein
MTDLRALLAAIRDANYHRPGVRCLRLFEARPATLAALVRDVEELRAAHAPSLPRDPAHVTAWARPRGRVEQYSLLTASGRYDDFSRDHDLSCFGKRFRDGARYPALGALIDELPHLINARINVLAPGASLPPHEEHSVVRSRAGTVGLRARFHLPLVTNDRATLLLDGDVYHLESGVVHLINHGCVHAAENQGASDRVHLVWDMLLTLEAAEAMLGNGPALPGFDRMGVQAATPVDTREVSRWERIAPLVPEPDASNLDFLEVQ